MPEYRGITGIEAPRELWDLLVEGPRDDALATSLAESDRLLQVAEPDEGRLLLEIGDAFWSRPDAEVYRAAGQIVYTMGNLEEGQEITLIDGLRPGTIRRPSGTTISQPLAREDFRRPLIQISQPVAGSVVGPTIPVDLSLVPMRPVVVSLEVADGTVASTPIRNGLGQLDARDAPDGPATFEVEVEPGLTLRLPLELASNP